MSWIFIQSNPIDPTVQRATGSKQLLAEMTGNDRRNKAFSQLTKFLLLVDSKRNLRTVAEMLGGEQSSLQTEIHQIKLIIHTHIFFSFFLLQIPTCQSSTATMSTWDSIAHGRSPGPMPRSSFGTCPNKTPRSPQRSSVWSMHASRVAWLEPTLNTIAGLRSRTLMLGIDTLLSALRTVPTTQPHDWIPRDYQE